ncbi:hypothetical protein Tco_0400567 [Tanacetum coccineum]
MSRYIGIYLEQLEQGGLRIPFSTFFLAVIKHFGMHVSQLVPMGVNRDDFPTHYNENDAARLAEFIIPLRPPPRHLLYVYGLTTACRHPDRAYTIKDRDKNVIDMDTFLKLPIWTGTTVRETITEKNLEKPNSKIAATREKKDRQNLANAQAKRAREGNSKVTRKNKRVRKDQDLGRSSSIRVLSPALLHHGAPENAEDPPHVVQDDATRDTNNVEREVADLSRNNRVATSPATVNQPSPRLDHYNNQEHTALDANSFHSTYHEDTEEEAADCREMQAQSGLSKELGLLDAAHAACLDREKELLDRVKDLEKERDEWRRTASDQVERIRGLEEREKVLEGEKVALQAKTDQAEKDRHRLVREFIPAVVKRLHTSVEYRQSLAAPVSLCFTAGIWTSKKVAASYHLPMDNLMKIIPDVPPPPPEDRVETSVANDTADVL